MNRTIAALSLISSRARLGLPGASAGRPNQQGQEKAKLNAYILDKAPADIPHKLGINYDNKEMLLGYKVEPDGP